MSAVWQKPSPKPWDTRLHINLVKQLQAGEFPPEGCREIQIDPNNPKHQVGMEFDEEDLRPGVLSHADKRAFALRFHPLDWLAFELLIDSVDSKFLFGSVMPRKMTSVKGVPIVRVK